MKKIEKALFVFMLIFAALGVLTVFTYSKDKDNLTENEPITTQNDEVVNSDTYKVKSLDIPNNVFFAGERIPVENIDVREALDKEMHKVCFWHSEVFLYLKRANRYFPIIEVILKLNQIPDDFKYLAIAESGLTNVSSPAGARGYWQFMKETGKEFNLEINKEVDERYNLEKSTIAACLYLNRLYKKYKNWTLVAAAYNTGQGNLDKEIKRQKQDKYYDLLLNSETARYVYRIVAIKLIMQNPRKYGFITTDENLYQPIKFKTLEVDTSVTDFVEFAEKQGVTYKILKTYNPWLRAQKLTNSKQKKYFIKIPQ